jgi:nucleoside-diphosphate-sugar epimerase
VDEAVDAVHRLFDSTWTAPMNIGNPDEFTILELAELVLEEISTTSRIERRPLPIDDPRARCPDISLARRTLHWQPRTSLRDGLRKTIPYLRELVETEDARARVLG